jgi:putative membrane protein
MKEANIALSVAALALGVAACGGGDEQMRPQVPSDVTTTTGGATPATMSTPSAQPQPIETTTPSPSPVVDDALPGRGPLDKGGTLTTGPRPRSAPAWDEPSGRMRHAATPLTDAEIVGVVDSADRSEKQLAREVLKRTQSVRVRQLAQLSLTDHGEAKLERLERRASLTPVDNETSAQLESSFSQNIQALQSSSDRDVDQAYVDAVASEERELIRLLDDKLIPEAQNAELRTFLQEVRTTASSRLGAATEIQSPRSR